MDIKSKHITVDPSVAAAAAALGGGSTAATTSVTSAKAQANAPINNDYGFVVNGKVPTTLTLSQLKSALADTTNNAPAIVKMTADVAKVPGALANLSVISQDGSITPIEQNYLTNYALNVVNNTPKGKPASIADAVTQKIVPSAVSPYAINSTINLQSIDRPDIAAVKSTVNDLYEQLLGKKADDATVAKWAQVYDNYAATRPTSQTTGGVTYGLQSVPTATGGASNRLIRSGQQETSTANQLTAENFIKNQIVDSGDYKAFQASGAAFNLLGQIASKDAGVA